MSTYTFKQALLAKRHSWTVADGRVERDGALFVDLRNVRKGRFASMKVRYTHSTWLDLVTPGGNKRLNTNLPPGDDNYRALAKLLVDVLNALAVVRPDTRIEFGTGGKIGWAMFLIGLSGAGFGLIILIAGLSGAVNPGKELFAFLFGAGFVFALGMLAWKYRPWRKRPDFDAQTAALMVSALTGTLEPQDGASAGKAPEQGKG